MKLVVDHSLFLYDYGLLKRKLLPRGSSSAILDNMDLLMVLAGLIPRLVDKFLELGQLSVKTTHFVIYSNI